MVTSAVADRLAQLCPQDAECRRRRASARRTARCSRSHAGGFGAHSSPDRPLLHFTIVPMRRSLSVDCHRSSPAALYLDQHTGSVSALRIAPITIARLLMLSSPTRFRRRAALNGRDEILAARRDGRRRGRRDRAPASRPDNPCRIAARAAHRRFRRGCCHARPRPVLPCSQTMRHALSQLVPRPLAHPTAAIGEDRRRRSVRTPPPPRSPARYHEPGGIPFPAINRYGIQAGDAARGIEGMDCHVKQKHVRHLLAEAAEMRGEEEIAMQARHASDARRKRAAAGSGAAAPCSGDSG